MFNRKRIFPITFESSTPSSFIFNSSSSSHYCIRRYCVRLNQTFHACSIMSLIDLVDNTHTDKNTTHSYLSLYQQLLQSKKETATDVLEVGIQCGGSIKLWKDFFPNATVVGVDVMKEKEVWDEIRHDRIQLYTERDAYETDFFVSTFLEKETRFDFLLDDGPHTLDSMVRFIQLYAQIMKEDGILIIEDVQAWEWMDILRQAVPASLQPYVRVYDLRAVKGRYDDLVFTIDRRSTPSSCQTQPLPH